jgi:hypothetical protein
MSSYLSEEHWGRVCLHFVAALRGGHWSWHLAGIRRELRVFNRLGHGLRNSHPLETQGEKTT